MVQEAHRRRAVYDPWGLELAPLGYNAPLNAEDRFKFNGGSERETGLGLHWDETPFRPYDAQLGRFHGIDLLADMFPGITPMHFGYNNPVLFNDPTGLWSSNSSGWHTSDPTEIADFMAALSRAGKNVDIVDAKKGNEEGELFRVVGSGEVGVFHGEDQWESGGDFGIRTEAHPDDIDDRLKDVPYVGNVYSARDEFGEGNYGQGTLYAGLVVLDVATFGEGSAAANTGKGAQKVAKEVAKPKYISAIRASWEKSIGELRRRGVQVHHLIPAEMKKKFAQLADVNLDDAITNGVALHSKGGFHKGSHPDYNKWVANALTEIDLYHGGIDATTLSRLRNALMQHIDDAAGSGQKLNDYFGNLAPFKNF